MKKASAAPTRFLKNIMGLWLVQRTRDVWARAGENYDYADLAAAAQSAAPFRAWVHPNDPRFLAPANMLAEVQGYCADTNQPVPQTVPEVMRCLLESLAFAYREAVEDIERLRGISVPALHITGGGSQNRPLCQWTANALHRPVIAGPVEGTAMGNLLVQLMALGEVAGLAECREVVRNSSELLAYQPEDTAAWQQAYSRYREVTQRGTTG